jgi:uncharacterized glyoxalase superfamily protein PhnB
MAIPIIRQRSARIWRCLWRAPTAPRLTRIFSDLAEGGKVNMPLAKQPWGGEVGWLVDRFGIAWTVSIHQA